MESIMMKVWKIRSWNWFFESKPQIEQETQGEQTVKIASSSKPSGLTKELPDDVEMLQGHQPAIDFVLYLQQTGSIIALAN